MRLLALALSLSLLACRSRDETDPDTWIRRLDDRDAKVRVQAVQQLRKLKAKQAAREVAALLKDPLVKEDAALALEDLGGPGQVDALLDAVDTTVGAGSDAAARAANRTNARIAEALGNIGDPRAGPALLRLARATDDTVRLAAVEALGNVKASEAIPEVPIIFTKVPETVIGSGDEILYPSGVSAALDYEAELGVVIGKGGRHIPRSSAADCVWGYTIINDVTARDWQARHKQWFLGKSFDSFCPMGPWLVTADEVDASNLSIRCWVNDELRQDANTGDLIFDIPTLIETISAGITLYPGDVIATGTPKGTSPTGGFTVSGYNVAPKTPPGATGESPPRSIRVPFPEGLVLG